MTLAEFSRLALRWSGFALYAVALLALVTGVVVEFVFGAEVIFAALSAAFLCAIGGTAMIGLSSLLSEVVELRAEVAEIASHGASSAEPRAPESSPVQ